MGVIEIKKPANFSFSECLYFLDRGYDDCLYTIENNRIIKPITFRGNPLLFAVSDDAEFLNVELLSGEHTAEAVDQISDYVTHWFDLNRDLDPFYALLNRHHQLAGLAKEYFGLRLMGIPDLLEALCWCVIGQHINLNFAHTLKRRLVETYGASLNYQSGRHYLFPEPGELAGLSVNGLKELQFSRQKAEYIIGIAGLFADGDLNKQEIAELKDTRRQLKRLKEIRGVGDWTANYVLMKSLGRTDCITYGDTGLQSAVSHILELNRKPTKEEVDEFFKPLAGWESYLVIYLWRSLS